MNDYQTSPQTNMAQGKPSTQEIPEQMDRLNSMIQETSSLLASLNHRLSAVMPPAVPEPIGNGSLTGGSREPSSPLGNQLAAVSAQVSSQNTDIRYLLERIKL
jgi:hypothetical protein